MALPGYLGGLAGASEDKAFVKDPRFEYDVFGHIVQKPYTTTSPLLSTDPLVKQLNSKYKYTTPDLQPLAYAEGGAGWDATKGKYGSWDLGNQMALVPKQNPLYLTDKEHPLQEGTIGFLQQLNSKEAPTNADGSFNADGWQVVSTKSNALGGVLGTLGVLGAAAGSALWGPAGGLTTDLTGSFDGLMTGALQTAGGSGVASGAGGLLGGVEGEWTPINGDAGLNNYVSNINVPTGNFGLPLDEAGNAIGISGDASLDGYVKNVLDGVSIGDGTYSGVPDADTSYNQNTGSSHDFDYKKFLQKAATALTSGKPAQQAPVPSAPYASGMGGGYTAGQAMGEGLAAPAPRQTTPVAVETPRFTPMQRVSAYTPPTQVQQAPLWGQLPRDSLRTAGATEAAMLAEQSTLPAGGGRMPYRQGLASFY